MPGFSPARNPLRHQIESKVVVPHSANILHPDSGLAFASTGYYRDEIGSSNQVHEGFWETLGSNIINGLLSLFGGLKSDDAIVDVWVRTPAGVRMFPNLPIHANNMSGQDNTALRQALKDHTPIEVKLTYDGGRPSEATIISWRVSKPNAKQINANANSAASVNPPAGTTGNGGGWGFPGDTPISPGQASLETAALGKSDIPAYLAPIIDKAAKAHNIDPRLLAAVGWQESILGAVLDSNGLGDNGHGHGIWQLDPSSGASQADLDRAAKDPAFAADIAAGTLSNLIKANNGNVEAALIQYNAGPGHDESGTTKKEWPDGIYPYGTSVLKKYAIYKNLFPTTGPMVSNGGGWGNIGSTSQTNPGSIPTVGSTLGKTTSAAKYRFLTSTDHVLHKYTDEINAAGGMFGLDPNMLAAAIMLKSSGNFRTTSGTGKAGLFGLTLAQFHTAYQTLLAKSSAMSVLPEDIYVEVTAIFTGAAFMSDLLSKNSNRYKNMIIAFGLGAAGTTSLSLTGAPSAQATAYYEKFKAKWLAFQRQSVAMGGDLINRRPEVTKQNLTGTSKYTGKSGGLTFP